MQKANCEYGRITLAMLKQRLEQKQLLKLTPQQILTLKLLTLPQLQIEEKIQHELEENPALEQVEERLEDDSFQNDEKSAENDDYENFEEDEDYDYENDIPAYKTAQNFSDETPREKIIVSGESFHENLLQQLDFFDFNKTEREIAEFLIGNIDESGYLSRTTDALTDDLAFLYHILVSENEVKEILNQLTARLDPPGVGAENLRECLLLQLRRKPLTNANENAQKILNQCFEPFTKKQYPKILQKLNLPEPDFKDALTEILKCDPKPGIIQNETQRVGHYAVPDFVITQVGQKLELSLCGSYWSELRVNENYAQLQHRIQEDKTCKSQEKQEALQFIKQKTDAAQCFIAALKQREQTMIKVMYALMNLQKDFFLTGHSEKLKPMILKDIATITNLDISTVSRVINHKYVQTDFGIIVLKDLFSNALITDSGDEISSKQVKNLILEAIQNENPKQPLTDDAIGDMLRQKGMPIARRTVAKYREMLNIPKSNLRKN